MSGATPLLRHLEALHAEFAAVSDGVVADYIPALASADPDRFGISLVTVDGTRYAVGDTGGSFTIQSVSKPFVYGLALADRGFAAVDERVGVEPTGDAFNSIRVDEASQRPYNPLVNTGAIVTTGLVGGATDAERWERILDGFAAVTGRRLVVDDDVFASERATGDRNRAIVYLMRNLGMLDGDPEGVLDLYFRQCSLLVTTDDLAVAAATLAAGGRNPITGARALTEPIAERVLSVMQTCGMYDGAGAWAVDVGFPAKSGVSGSVLAVLPGIAGIAVHSPPLDPQGNSVRGIAVCRRLARDFGLHPLRDRGHPAGVVRGSSRGGQARSTRERDAAEVAWIEARGDDLIVHEVQGTIRFAEAEHLVAHVLDHPVPARVVALDGRRVALVDPLVVPLLAGLATALGAEGRTLVLCGFADTGADDALAGVARAFPDLDVAVEWWEDGVVAERAGDADAGASRRIEDQELLAGLAPDDLAAVLAAVTPVHLAAGEVLARQGEPADSVFFLLSGRLSVRLGADATTDSPRVAAFGPGVAVGELALIQGGTRSASLVADTAADLAVLTVAAFERIGAERPAVHGVVLGNLARSLATRLRRANDRIRVLDR